MAKKDPRPAMMANYYEKLTRIFHTSPCALGRWQPWHANEAKGYPLRFGCMAAVAHASRYPV
ncbi:hypothetical protein R3P38DRAFT_3187654 [Favolaschia claudopus]|uniref:DUF255 domain-containing protein n=1 Tax=Favolaschia claudopus TaxID=2862362 RepID=A0AAW0BXQ3_9AGAR